MIFYNNITKSKEIKGNIIANTNINNWNKINLNFGNNS